MTTVVDAQLCCRIEWIKMFVFLIPLRNTTAHMLKLFPHGNWIKKTRNHVYDQDSQLGLKELQEISSLSCPGDLSQLCRAPPRPIPVHFTLMTPSPLNHTGAHCTQHTTLPRRVQFHRITLLPADQPTDRPPDRRRRRRRRRRRHRNQCCTRRGRRPIEHITSRAD